MTNQSELINETVMCNKFIKCSGHKAAFQNDVFISFPFQLYTIKQIDLYFENGSFHSKQCFENGYKVFNQEKLINDSCSNLKFNSTLNKIINRSLIFDNHLNHEYMSYTHLTSKIAEQNKKINELKLVNLVKEYQIIAYRNKIGLYKRFMVLLANNEIERVRQLVHVCLKNGNGIKSIIDNG